VIVVADTTPLNYLILIQQIDILRVLYGRVVVPAAVLAEMRAEAAPVAVRE
jgi:predicted nucleic acid-binding protein